MKRIFNKSSLALLLFLIIITGCKKDFLDVGPQGQLTEEQALIDPAAADKLVGGVYNALYLPGTVGVRLVILGDITSDDADKGSVPTDPGLDAIFIDAFTHNANTDIFNIVWNENYKGIARANKALEILNTGSYEEATRNRLIGEVRFIRALLYFNLVREFGGVPKVIRVPLVSEANNEEFQTRATKNEIYQVIIDDLNFGIANLPLKNGVGAQVGRATRGAAQSLLSKVFLYQENWQGAYDLSLAVMNSGLYDLAPNYANIFREIGANNIESIFEVQTGPNRTGTTCDAISPNYSNFQGPRGSFPNNEVISGQIYDGDLGFGLNTPTADLASAYSADDTLRRDGTIIFTSPSDTIKLWDDFVIPAQPAVVNERYNYKAYHSPFRETQSCNGLNDKDNKPKNIRLIRFAEVLLINAEAATYIGQDALTPLQRVRTRAGLTTSSATVTDIWNERRLELAMEADRFFDLVRTGRAASVMIAHGKPFVAGKHELFPIPQVQIDLSVGRLTQNPGY